MRYSMIRTTAAALAILASSCKSTTAPQITTTEPPTIEARANPGAGAVQLSHFRAELTARGLLASLEREGLQNDFMIEARAWLDADEELDAMRIRYQQAIERHAR